MISHNYKVIMASSAEAPGISAKQRKLIIKYSLDGRTDVEWKNEKDPT